MFISMEYMAEILNRWNKGKKKLRENDEKELMSMQNGLISSVKSGLSQSWVMWFFMELLGFTAQISKCLGAMACQI